MAGNLTGNVARTAPKAKNLRDVFSERQAADFKRSVSDGKKEDLLNTWFPDYTRAIANQGQWLMDYGIKAGMFKSKLSDIGKKGILRYFVELFPDSEWLNQRYIKSKSGDINMLPSQMEDSNQVLQALLRSVEEVDKLLKDVSQESTDTTLFYDGLLDDLSTQKRGVLEERKTLEGIMQQNRDELASKKAICVQYGVPFTDSDSVQKSALPVVGTSLDELTKEQERSDAIRAYESVYYKLIEQKEQYTALERKTADLQIRINRATEESDVNNVALKGTIANLLAHQQLLKSEYTATLESTVRVGRIAAKVAVAEALNARAGKALKEFHNNMGELINLTVKGGANIMKSLRDLVESDNYSAEQMESYRSVVADTKREIDELYQRLAENVEQARVNQVQVPDLPTSYTPAQ